MERNIAFIALFAALIAVLGLVPSFALPIGIPISAQSLGIMLCGTILGAKRGALAVVLFVGLVALGLPLLAGGRGGLMVFSSPYAGFYFGFPFAAFFTGLIVEKWRSGSLGMIAGVAAIIGGIGVLYAITIPYYMASSGTNFVSSIYTMLPFMPGDLIKAVLAGIITAALYKARPAAVLSRA